MKKVVTGLAICTLWVMTLGAQDRGIDLEPVVGKGVTVGKQWAVFIAIDRYREWKNLSNPVKDAREIRDILRDQYYIDEIRELYNQDATARNIRQLFDSLRREIGYNDSVFVFYAGHGYTDEITKSGSWIPTDGGSDHYAQANWLPNIHVRNMLAALPAKHVFLVSDACFSGDILDTNRDSDPRIDGEYYRRAYGKVSRQVMTSGAAESVPDVSEFALRLKSGLRRAEGACIDPEYLFVKVREVRSTQPMLGVILGSEHEKGGSFLFFRKTASVVVTPPPVAPRNVRAGTPGTDHVTLSWESAGAGVRYKIYRGTTNDPARASALSDGTTTTMDVTGLSGGIDYYFWVTSVQNGVESEKSPVVSVKTAAAAPVNPPATVKPVAPPPDKVGPIAPPERPVPSNMVRIQGGIFTMGSTILERGRYRGEGPRHKVTVSSFYLGKYEVTQKEYRELMGSNPSYFKGDNLPVENVSWYDAVEYCNARSRKEGLTPAYTVNGTSVSWNRSANGYRLPTEAEWEYACRAGTTTPYSSGRSVDNAGWYGNNSGGKTHPVGEKKANAWGLYDMHGNVWEWCWDWYGAYSSGSQTDPVGDSSGSFRVIRGGSWLGYGLYLRSAFRSHYGPSVRNYYLGFRLLRP